MFSLRILQWQANNNTKKSKARQKDRRVTKVIAIDAMGGDFAPKIVIDGLFLFHQRCPDSSFLLYGDESLIMPILKTYSSLEKVCMLTHTTEVIDANTKPMHALRGLPQASMRLALEAVASGQAKAAVSSGNTGAYLALAKTILKTLPGIDRPVIASQIPTEKGESIMLDLGGSLGASSRNLVEYALMGDAFARSVLGITHPSIGLLNVGREESKGNDVLQQTFATLKSMPINFFGFIEGDDIYRGTVSVIVTDGFTGNVSLKTGEGVYRLLMSAFKKSLSSSWKGKLLSLLARSCFKEIKQHFDPRSYNGALWLGLNGIAVKSHGGSDAVGFANAVEVAYDMAIADITSVIEQTFSQWSGIYLNQE